MGIVKRNHNYIVRAAFNIFTVIGQEIWERTAAILRKSKKATFLVANLPSYSLNTSALQSASMRSTLGPNEVTS